MIWLVCIFGFFTLCFLSVLMLALVRLHRAKKNASGTSPVKIRVRETVNVVLKKDGQA